MSLDLVRARLALVCHLANGGPDRVVVDEAGGRVYIYHPASASGERCVSQLFLDYSSDDLAKKVVQILADDPDLVVENDFGTTLSGDQFVARIRSQNGWNWRII